MFRYLVLDAVFLIPAAYLFSSSPKTIRRRMLEVMGWLLLLTLMFDNIIIAARIVDYSPARILGWRLLYAPIEDFAYPVWAAIVLPFIYERLSKNESTS